MLPCAAVSAAAPARGPGACTGGAIGRPAAGPAVGRRRMDGVLRPCRERAPSQRIGQGRRGGSGAATSRVRGIACHVAGARQSPEPKGGGGGRSRWPAWSASADAESRRKSPPRRGGSSGARQMAAGAGSPAAVSNPPAYCFRSSLAGGHMADGGRGRGGRQGAQPLASEGRPALHPGPKLIPTDPSSSLSSDQVIRPVHSSTQTQGDATIEIQPKWSRPTCP